MTLHNDIHATGEVHEHEDDFHEDFHEYPIEGFEEPRNLRAPEALPGMHQAWIREDEIQDFEMNGYERRLASTISKSDRAFRASRNQNSQFIESAGMVLVQIPEERHRRLVKATVEAKHKRNVKATSEMLMDISQAAGRQGADPIEAGIRQTVSHRE